MYYEINVTKNNRHFFATAERSLTCRADAIECLGELMKRFPEPEFAMTVSERIHSGKDVTQSIFDSWQQRNPNTIVCDNHLPSLMRHQAE